MPQDLSSAHLASDRRKKRDDATPHLGATASQPTPTTTSSRPRLLVSARRPTPPNRPATPTSDKAATNRLSRGPSAGPRPGRAPHRFHMSCLPQLSHPVRGTRSVLEQRFRQLVHSKKRSVALMPFWSCPRSLHRLLNRLRLVLHCALCWQAFGTRGKRGNEGTVRGRMRRDGMGRDGTERDETGWDGRAKVEAGLRKISYTGRHYRCRLTRQEQDGERGEASAGPCLANASRPLSQQASGEKAQFGTIRAWFTSLQHETRDSNTYRAYCRCCKSTSVHLGSNTFFFPCQPKFFFFFSAVERISRGLPAHLWLLTKFVGLPCLSHWKKASNGCAGCVQKNYSYSGTRLCAGEDRDGHLGDFFRLVGHGFSLLQPLHASVGVLRTLLLSPIPNNNSNSSSNRSSALSSSSSTKHSKLIVAPRFLSSLMQSRDGKKKKRNKNGSCTTRRNGQTTDLSFAPNDRFML